MDRVRFAFIVPPQLPAVEEILPDGIQSQINGGQRIEISVGNPDAHRGVFLSQQLSACYRVPIFVSNPFAKAKLYDTENDGSDA